MQAESGDSRDQCSLYYQIVLLGRSQKTHPEAECKTWRVTERGLLLPDSSPCPVNEQKKAPRKKEQSRVSSSERHLIHGKTPELAPV